MRRALLITLAWPLAACVSVPLPKLPSAPKAAAAAPAAPQTPSCPGGLRADLQPAPKLPDAAGFPKPVSTEERASVAAYLEWLSTFAAWGRSGWERAADAKTFCDTAK